MAAIPPSIQLLITVIGLAGIGISVLAIRSFHLQQWKTGLYYIAAAIVLYTIQEVMELLEYGARQPAINVALQVGVLSSLIYGLLHLKRTAETLGA